LEGGALRNPKGRGGIRPSTRETAGKNRIPARNKDLGCRSLGRNLKNERKFLPKKKT